MKKFTFSLARLERLRSLHRQQTRIALAAHIAESRQAEAATQQMGQALQSAQATQLPAELAEQPEAWRALGQWRDALQQAHRAAQSTSQQVDARLATAQAAHTEASRQHEVLLRLRERRYERWLAEAAREEQKLLDEAHLQRLNLKRRR